MMYRAPISWKEKHMTFTTKTILAALVALMIAVASVLAVTSAMNTVYQRGLMDGVQATMDAKHGSPAESDSGDVSTMNPYDHKICDYSINGREAISIAYSRGAQDARLAFDNNGAYGGCNNNGLPFYGSAHQACKGNMFGCGRISDH